MALCGDGTGDNGSHAGGRPGWTPPHGIENEGFNHAVVLLLLVMLGYNLLHGFYVRNLKPAVRRRVSLQHVAREITAGLYVPLL